MKSAILVLTGASFLAAQPAKAPALQVGAWKNLKYGKLGDVRIPDIEVVTLKNGIKVYLLENHALPFITGSALVRTGSLLDPAPKKGLSEFTGDVLRSGGTKSKTGDQLNEQLENIAASVESNSSDEMATVSFNCLKENIDEVLGVFVDVLTQPEFRQAKIDLLKTQYRSAIARRYDDADSIAGSEFNAIVYGRETPFGSEVEYENIDAIGRADLIAFYQRYYHPSNIVLSVQGDFDKAAMKARLEQTLGGWAPQAGAPPVFPKVTNVAKPGLYFGEKKDVTQTFLSIGHLGGLLSDKDYAALEVMSDILGGGFDSRLFRKVRTELGYAYSVGGGWGADYNHPGTFRIFASTKAESTVETIQAILKEIDRIRTEPVTDLELNTAKEKVVNRFVFNFDRPVKTLSRIVRYDYHSYPRDFLAQYQKAMAAVTKADILRVAKQYIDPAKFVYVAVGNPDSFKTPLTDLKLPITKLDLTVKQPAKPAAETSDATLAKGKAIFAKIQQAVGGVDKLKSIKDFSSTATAALGNMQAKQKTWLILPNQFRQEQELPFGKVVATWDGSKGMFTAPGAPAAVPMPAPIQKQLTDELFRNWITLLQSDTIAGRTINSLSDTLIEISDKSGQSVKITIDPATSLPAKVNFQMAGPPGASDIEVVYKDWREAGPIKLPYQMEMFQAGRKAAETKIETISINSGVTLAEIMK